MKGVTADDLKWLSPSQAKTAVLRAAELQAQGIPCVLALALESSDPAIPAGARQVLPLSADPDGLSDPDSRELLLAAQRLRSTAIGCTIELRRSAGALRVFLDPVTPPSQLIILGAGHVGAALTQLGIMLGFDVCIIDDRPEFAHPDRLPAGCRILTGPFPQILDQVPASPRTYWVIATRGHRSDEICLRAVLGKSGAYTGMLSSRHKARLLLQKMISEGAPAEAVEAVRAPIGLPIGSATPEEIAVSIAAELVAVRSRLESQH